MSVLSAAHFHDEEAAYAWVEARVWPEGRICPHCGTVDQSGKLAGKSTRLGVYKCYACRKPFTVKIGTIFEASHVKMHLWLQAIYLMCSSKKGISSNQLHRTLGVTLKTAWFMSHRIREAMAGGNPGPLGGMGKVVEADETFLGQPEQEFVNGRGWQAKRAFHTKTKVLSLVERGGRVRSQVIADFKPVTISGVLAQVDHATRLHTDEGKHYNKPGRVFVAHERVNHSKQEYARGDVTTNTVEGFFGLFKRGMKGIYQHCGEHYLHRYLAEFDFRYSNRVALNVDDVARTSLAVQGVVGKRLTYRTTRGRA